MTNKVDMFYHRLGKLQVMVSPSDKDDNPCNLPVRTEEEEREFREMIDMVNPELPKPERDRRMQEYCSTKL